MNLLSFTLSGETDMQNETESGRKESESREGDGKMFV